MKKCKKCNIEKELTDFHKNTGTKDGHKNKCKECIRQHYTENKDGINKKQKEYQENNKEKIREYKKKYRENNKEDINKKQRKHYKDNREKINEKSRNYYNNNKNKKKEYYVLNKDKINKYYKERRKNEPLFRLSKNIRTSISKCSNGKGFKKSSNTHKIIGCNFDKLLYYLNDNIYGFVFGKENIDIDHIIPLSSTNTEEEIYKLNHYTNLQLLPSYYNRHIKRDNVFDEENFKEWLLNYNI